MMKSNTEYAVKKAAKRLYFLKTLKGYNVPPADSKIFYISAIRSMWNMKLKFGMVA